MRAGKEEQELVQAGLSHPLVRALASFLHSQQPSVSGTQACVPSFPVGTSFHS